MQVTKIKMRTECENSDNTLEIDSLYIVGCNNPGYYKKETVYDYLINHPGSIQVGVDPYPNIVPAISENGEKYVKSTPDDTDKDNLLNLPRE